MKRHLLLFFLPLLVLCAKADPVEINGIYYNLVTKAKVAEVTSNPNKYSGNINIPESINYEGTEYNVTSIGELAFWRCTDLVSVTMPNSVISIGQRAFDECSGLTKITMPSSLTSISNGTFSECSKLTSITIPDPVISIGENAFFGCSGLTSITIPNSVTSVGYQAFSGCSGLTSVHINDLKSWCNIKFDYFSNPLFCAHKLFLNGEEIKDLIIPNSVTSIGAAFRSCTSLTSVTIPNSVTSIGIAAFGNCSNLTNVKIPNSVTSIGAQAFEFCTSLSIITIPNSVKSIDDHAFGGCTGLSTIIIGSGVISIGKESFADCKELTDVTCYAENVPSTNSDAFNNSYIEYATLHVPAGSVEGYKTTSPWNSFKNIVAISNDDSTGIESIDGTATTELFDVYDMSGRKVLTHVTSLDGLSNGVYIINGKKMIIK